MDGWLAPTFLASNPWVPHPPTPCRAARMAGRVILAAQSQTATLGGPGPHRMGICVAQWEEDLGLSRCPRGGHPKLAKC